jgi:hypothetical protein
MAIVFYSGNKVTGLSTDAKPTFVAVNAIFYETNTKKTYDFTGGSWVERASGLQLTDNVTINSSTASLESWLEHGVVVPDPATGLTATADGTTTTTLSYTLSGADGVTSSAVEKATVIDGSVGSYSSVGSTSNTSTYQVTGLTTDTDYKFKITPSNFIGAGSSTTSGTVNTWKIPTVPTNLTLTQYLQTGITATWTASTSETPTPVTAITYTLERSNDGSSGWTAYSGLTSSPYNDTNATADVVQYYRIKSTNSAGSSSYSSNVSFTYSPFNSPQFIADGTTTREINDPIMRGSPTTGGQYISDTRFQGISISTVKLWLGKNGTGGNATITCRINGTTLGTIHTSAINGSGTYSPTEVTFTGSAITTPNSAYHIDFVMSGYSGSPPSDYTMFGYRSGDLFSGGYATQSGSQTGTGKDLCMRVYFT